jgi:hypothetical protein
MVASKNLDQQLHNCKVLIRIISKSMTLVYGLMKPKYAYRCRGLSVIVLSSEAMNLKIDRKVLLF